MQSVGFAKKSKDTKFPMHKSTFALLVSLARILSEGMRQVRRRELITPPKVNRRFKNQRRCGVYAQSNPIPLQSFVGAATISAEN